MSPAEVIKKRGRERECNGWPPLQRERDRQTGWGFGTKQEAESKESEPQCYLGFCTCTCAEQSAGRGAWWVNAPWFGGRVCLLKRQADQLPFTNGLSIAGKE